MRKKSFVGGVHPFGGKEFTEKKPVETLPPPNIVYVPIQQHIGAPTAPVVEKGQAVKRGEKLSESSSFVSAPVHSPISGKVKSIVDFAHPVIGHGLTIVIENDDEENKTDLKDQSPDSTTISPRDIIERIKEGGLAGLGGATFPTHVKLSPPPDKKIDTIMLNGAECEPYLTADHRLMLENPKEIVEGLQLMMKVLGVNRGIIGIEDNKPDAIQRMKKEVKEKNGIEVEAFPVKYPQGAEKQLIKAALNRDVPAGGLPMDVGVVVQNVGTAKAVYDAVIYRRPLTHRVVTVTGPGVNEPKNILVPIGTLFRDVIDFCGGLKDSATKIIMGGPMMGLAQSSLDVPVVKGTSGILVLDEKQSHLLPEEPCIGCGRCIEVCPMHLLPTTLQALVDHGRFLAAEGKHIMDCIECGSCSYICPANRNLLQSIRWGKREILAIRKKTA